MLRFWYKDKQLVVFKPVTNDLVRQVATNEKQQHQTKSGLPQYVLSSSYDCV